MKIRRYLTLVLCSLLTLVVSLPLQAQKTVTGAQRDEMIRRIGQAASELSSLSCDFVQVKQLSLLNDKLTSRGKMYYKAPSSLRWEYTTPYAYTFVLSGTKVLIKSGTQKNVIDTGSSRLFQEIARLMMGTVTGKCLSGSDSFEVELQVNGQEWVARMVPRKKELKRMFASVALYFDATRAVVNKVRITESSGDDTLITLSHVVTGKELPHALFAVD